MDDKQLGKLEEVKRGTQEFYGEGPHQGKLPDTTQCGCDDDGDDGGCGCDGE
jgi:hypothetical protein